MTETIKQAVLRAPEARMTQCKCEIEKISNSPKRDRENNAYGDMLRENFSYWCGELEAAIAAHLHMQEAAVKA